MITKLVIIWLTVCVIKAAQSKDENSFLTAINSEHYVDKTGFIEYYHDTFTSPIFFTAPLGFGKTTNLFMLKAFYEINTSENGTTMKKEETPNYRAFQRVQNITAARGVRSVRTLLDEDKFFRSNFGSQPVIYLSFKDIHERHFEAFMDSLKWLMIRAFNAHPYLNVSEKLSSEEKALCGIFLSTEVRGYQLIENSGGTLAKLLSKHFEKPCLLLIDDFDKPIIKMFTNGSYDMDHIVKRLQIFTNQLFSDKKAVNRAFLTGKTRLAGIYTPSGIKHYQFGLHAGITEFFGVRKIEVRGLTKKSMALYQQNVLYRGFTMVNSTDNILDPVTITEFSEGRNHTRVLDSDVFLKAILEDRAARDKIELAIRENALSITEPKETDHDKCIVTFGMIYKHGDLYSELELEKPDQNCLFYYLFELGYFTVISKKGVHLTLALPDMAVHDALCAEMERFWVGYLDTTDDIAEDFVDGFMGLTYDNSTLDALADAVTKLFEESPHRPTSAADLRSPLFTFLATRVQQYPALELWCDGKGKRTCSLQAVTQRKNHSQKGVVLVFMHNNCSKEGFAANVKMKRSWERFRTIRDDQDVQRFLIIGVCLSKKDEFEFTFVYNSKKHDKAYEVFRKMKPWRLRKKKTRRLPSTERSFDSPSTERNYKELYHPFVELLKIDQI